jgi:hypothetical protein
MNIEMIINAIRVLINSFQNQTNVEKLQTYATIQVLLGEIKKYADQKEEDGKPIPNVNIYIAELITPLRCMAGLEDTGHYDSQNIVWLLKGLDKLLSEHCFNIKA